MDRPPLYELTKSFCVAFYDNNQTALNQLLSADCRMQNRYGRTARGVNGIASCINKLITLRSSIATHFPHGQGGSEMFVETFTSNFSQSCCILTIQTGDRLRKLSVCFGLEWDCNIVIGIVFRYNVDPRFYIRDLYSQDPVDDADRAPTSWDMSVSIVGAVLSSSDLEDCSGHGEEQSIFLHRKPGVTTQAEVDEESCSTLSEASAHTATVAEARPISRCLRPAFATLERAKACVERRVGFSLELAVVLVPELKCKPNDGIFYTHIDFRRFSVDAEDDINELIKVSKVSFMDKDSAKLVLYQDPAVPLMTQFNTELSIGDVACELSEDDGPPGISCEESPGPRRVASMSREPSITRALSFDDDIDRESFSKHHGVSVDGAGGSKGTDDVSWFDRLYDIITGALDADEPVRHHVEPDKRILLNYYLNTSSDAKVQSSLLPLGYSLGRLLTVPSALDQREHWVTIDVSVIGCNNLRSVLKRLFTRPVDSFVEIKINDQIQCTEVQKNEKNPLYDLSSTFSFRLKPSQAGLNNFITFTVYDEGLIDNSVIGFARVSFAALKAQKDNSDPTAIILPLARHIEDIDEMGKGFFNSNNYYLSRSSGSRDSRYGSRDSFSQKNKLIKSAKETPTISIAVSKIDLLTHSLLEALKNADEEHSKMIAEKDGSDPWNH